MSTDQEATNKATSKRFTDAVNSGDTELIAKTIDELVAPDALLSTPLPIEATGAELAKQGEHLGVPPTGKPVTYNEIFIARFADVRIAETWGVVDVLSQMRQLGAIPGAEPAGAA
jgi:SnoaL-like polyketide cyclase